MTVGKVNTHINTQLNPFGPQWPNGKAEGVPTLGQQVQQVLFRGVKPPLLDPALFPEVAAQLRLLRRYLKKLAVMAGDNEDDYSVVLADGTIAMIDEAGTIYLGVGFLQKFAEKKEVLVGALAHEVGHRPKRWNDYSQRQRLNDEELAAICREEETRADIFAGRALAEMDLDCEPLAEFLLALGDGSPKPHPEYFDAQTRSFIIREAHADRSYGTENRRKIFPEFERNKSPKGHLGDF